jgi:hypothetical protein
MARRLRRRWVVVAVLVALLLGGIRLQDQPTTIYYYRVVDQQTLVVGTTVGPWAWMRVTSVNETPSTVTITVSSLLAPMGGSYGDLELLVKLAAPLGSRGVVDGGSGLPIPRTRCLPPSDGATGCT